MTRKQLAAMAMDVVGRRGTLDDGVRTLLDAADGQVPVLVGAEQVLRHQLIDGADTMRRRSALLMLGYAIRRATDDNAGRDDLLAS